jgi:uncharacterized protein (DUF58 family)
VTGERAATPRLRWYTLLAAAAFLGAVTAGRPEFALLGLPFALIVAAGLGLSSSLDLNVTLRLSSERAIEGDVVELGLHFESLGGVAWLEVEPVLPPAVRPVDGDGTVVVEVPPGEPVDVVVGLRCERWGAHRPCRVRLVGYDRFRFFVARWSAASSAVLRVHPSTERLRDVIAPRRLQALTGSHRSRERSDGIEFADTRPFRPGDRLRSVNWRASARRTELWVNDRHPDRNSDVVLFLDSFSAVGSSLDSTLDWAVRAAVALAERHVATHDRVGVVGLGGLLRWVSPGLGYRHLHRLVDSVLDTEVIASEADKGVDVIPPRALPPRAMVVALSPLVDPRSVAVLLELRGRGFDVVVIECSPLAFVAPAAGETEQLARRIWLLERDAARTKLRMAGAPVVEWSHDTPLAGVIGELVSWRRLPQRVAR